MKPDPIVVRFEKLANYIWKNRHFYNPEIKRSVKIQNWLDEYEELIDRYPVEFKMYCKKHFYTIKHDGYSFFYEDRMEHGRALDYKDKKKLKKMGFVL